MAHTLSHSGSLAQTHQMLCHIRVHLWGLDRMGYAENRGVSIRAIGDGIAAISSPSFREHRNTLILYPCLVASGGHYAICYQKVGQ